MYAIVFLQQRGEIVSAASFDFRVVDINKMELFVRLVLAQATGGTAEFNAVDLHDPSNPPSPETFIVKVQKHDSTPPTTFEVIDQHNRWIQLIFKNASEHLDFEVLSP